MSSPPSQVLASLPSRILATFIFSRFEAFIRRFTFVAAHSFAAQRLQSGQFPSHLLCPLHV